MSEFCARIDSLCEQPVGTATPETRLADMPGWDSMSAMGCMSMIGLNYGITVPAAKLLDAQTVADLASLAGVS